jgi:hypothetical protein
MKASHLKTEADTTPDSSCVLIPQLLDKECETFECLKNYQNRYIENIITRVGLRKAKTQETNFHAPSGIRIRDPSNEAAADLSLRPRGHWDRQAGVILEENVR